MAADRSVADWEGAARHGSHAREVIDGELLRSRRSQLPLALIMFDLDHFKDVNDHYGHRCGEAVLTTVGHRMKTVLRGSDLKCRWRAEEFLGLLPDTLSPGAQREAELVRRDLRGASRPLAQGDVEVDIRVTASFGLTTVTPGEIDTTAIIARADAALYRAKASGRNCVTLAEEPAAGSERA